MQNLGPEENVHECICLAVEWVVINFTNSKSKSKYHCCPFRDNMYKNAGIGYYNNIIQASRNEK